ncbi:hypothetical protein ABZV67_46785 [Streptomyces sp. NPDC005065]
MELLDEQSASQFEGGAPRAVGNGAVRGVGSSFSRAAGPGITGYGR